MRRHRVVRNRELPCNFTGWQALRFGSYQPSEDVETGALSQGGKGEDGFF